MLVTLSRDTLHGAVATLANTVARIAGDAGGHGSLVHSLSLTVRAENKVVPVKICPTHFVSVGLRPVLYSINPITY